MVNYNNSKIYKIVSSQTDKVYIGSTAKDKLCQRMAQHRANYKSYLNKKYHYVTSFEIIKYDDAEIILIEVFPCNTKDELHKRERYWIENTQNYINKHIPTRTDSEYYQTIKDDINEKRRENGHQLYMKDHRRGKVFDCECGGKTALQHKKRHEKSKHHQEYLESKNKL